MLYDTLGVLKMDHLPEVSDTRSATIVYLNQEFEGFKPGFYTHVDGEWAPFGGAGANTDIVETAEPTVLNMADYNPDGLLLSVLVTRNVEESRTITLVRTDTGEVQETVNLTGTYTSVSIPQPHRLYSLQVDADLTLNIKTI